MVRNFLISILEWAVRDLQIITESVLLNCDLHTLKYLEDKVQIWEQYEMRANERYFYDPKQWNPFFKVD